MNSDPSSHASIIFYGDGSTFEGDPLEASKPTDVQIVRYWNGKSYSLLHKRDFYLYVNGDWIGCDGLVDFVDQMLLNRVDKVFKGSMLSTKDFEAIFAKANSND